MRSAQWRVAVLAAGVLAGVGAEASHRAEQPKRHKVSYHLDEPGGELRFDACLSTMARQKIGLKELIAGATPVPCGVVRVMELQEAGYAYIKP